MLKRVLAIALCLSVRLSVFVTSRCSIETDYLIFDLVFCLLTWRLLSTSPPLCVLYSGRPICYQVTADTVIAYIIHDVRPNL